MKKKSFKERILSFGLFILILLLVFNFTTIIKKTSIALGISKLDWTVIKTIEFETDQVLDNRAVIFTHNKNIIVSFDHKLYLYDGDGEFIIKREVNSNHTRMIGMDDYFVVSDIIQGHIMVLDYLGSPVGTIESLGGIQDLVSVSNNMFVVITDKNELQVYTHQGVMISSVSLPEGELLSLDVSKDKETILVTILSSDDTHYNSKLITYSMIENSMIGAHNHYNSILYGARIYNTDILIVDYDGQHAYRIGEADEYLWESTRLGNLIHFEVDQNGNIFEIVEIDEVEDLLGQSEYHLTGINKDGKSIFDVELTSNYNDIVINEGQILIYNDRKLVIFDSMGQIIESFESNKKIYNVNWLSGNRILLEYHDYLEIQELSY